MIFSLEQTVIEENGNLYITLYIIIFLILTALLVLLSTSYLVSLPSNVNWTLWLWMSLYIKLNVAQLKYVGEMSAVCPRNDQVNDLSWIINRWMYLRKSLYGLNLMCLSVLILYIQNSCFANKARAPVVRYTKGRLLDLRTSIRLVCKTKSLPERSTLAYRESW